MHARTLWTAAAESVADLVEYRGQPDDTWLISKAPFKALDVCVDARKEAKHLMRSQGRASANDLEAQ